MLRKQIHPRPVLKRVLPFNSLRNCPRRPVTLTARAVEKGYRDARWMESEPRLKTLVESGRVDPLLERRRQLTPLQFRVDGSG